jgi:hypothetical protein
LQRRQIVAHGLSEIALRTDSRFYEHIIAHIFRFHPDGKTGKAVGQSGVHAISHVIPFGAVRTVYSVGIEI